MKQRLWHETMALTSHVNFLGNSKEYWQGVMRQICTECFSQIGNIKGVVGVNNCGHPCLAISAGNLKMN